jgi:hypothetical protein
MAYVREIARGYYAFNTEGVTVNDETQDLISAAFARARVAAEDGNSRSESDDDSNS